mgnify:CR=1 FL=1
MREVSQSDVKSGLYPWFVVIVLLVAYTLSFIDRQIISLLVDPIRDDLKISDTQISLLQGLAFALFYTLMGIPIAKWADTRSAIETERCLPPVHPIARVRWLFPSFS